MKVVVTARNFSTDDDSALMMLKNAGFDVEEHSAEDIGSGTDEEHILSLVRDADAIICGPETISKTPLFIVICLLHSCRNRFRLHR